MRDRVPRARARDGESGRWLGCRVLGATQLVPMEEKAFKDEAPRQSAKWAMMHDGDWFRNDPQVRLIALTKVKRYGDDNVMADGMEMLSWGLGDSQPAAREVARNRTRGRCW